MKAFLLNGIFLFSFFALTAQESSLKVGVSLIPEVSRSFLQRNDLPYSFHSRVSSTGKFGLNIQRPLSNRFNLRTGILYTLERYNIDIYNIYLESNNFAIETEIQEEVQLGSLMIPVQLQYKFNERWSVFSGIGLEFPFYTRRYRYIINGGEEEPHIFEKDRELERSWIALSLGFSRSIQQKFVKLEVSPQLWLHTHRSQIPIQALTHFQMSAGLELTAWLF